jgi:FkbM family methyltransferase
MMSTRNCTRRFVEILCLQVAFSFQLIYRWSSIPNHQSHRRSGLFSSVPTDNCKFCGAEFASRNAVFKHLRSSAECYKQTSNNDGLTTVDLPKRKMAIRFGYRLLSGSVKQKNNELAAQIVKDAFFETVKSKIPVQEGKDITQASAARLRHPCLTQDYDCSSSADVMCVNYKGGEIEMDTLVDQMQQRLINTENLDVQVINCLNMSVSTKFHAEQSCTQRALHYILPLEWLQDGREAEEWWLAQNSTGSRTHQPRGVVETPGALLRLKEALKHVETSDAFENRDKVSSPGRFGSLWQKERRCWHNFADPSLGGKASPSHDSVWRAIDRAHLVDFVSVGGDKVVAVIELRGDSFVTEQVRRIIGSVVAVVNGWLPDNYMEVATRPDVCVETPLAPPGRMYFASARYHFMELARGSTWLDGSNDKADRWLVKLQSELLQQRAIELDIEKLWINDLRDVTAPRICSQMERIASDDERRAKIRQDSVVAESIIRENSPAYSDPPPVFQETLNLLRSVAENGAWPRTSAARSRVIRSASVESDSTRAKQSPVMKSTTKSSFSGELFQSGSFTVVNEERFDGNLPLGNELFPELVESVFKLERQLASLPRSVADGTLTSDGTRPLSTHCAINRNAEFTPHVDSGRGLGQSISMIVGLGDFSGGSLFVEGKKYDARYTPLEFDGWSQRHWTEPFEGERFSLVWFTPEGITESSSLINGKHDTATADPSLIDRERDEDKRAATFLDMHTSQLSSYPPLKFRRNSTDALVINEILDHEKGCAYESSDFALRDHKCVLDIGAHIGVFSRFALGEGVQRVIAYEPESSNMELLLQNLKPRDGCETEATVEIHRSAVAHGDAGMRTLVLARSRNDGTLNTWRHALEDYSQYLDKTTVLPSPEQEAVLTRSPVNTVPLFGSAGALTAGVTLVKLDCEGAEIDILLSAEARRPESWLDVTHLVFEWSFTKERRIQMFHQAVLNLASAGFKVSYEGNGSWWDTERNVMWPYHNDLVVFAQRAKLD